MRLWGPPIPAAERRRLVEERCRRSASWAIIHWLGSLHFALLLLSTIAIACAIATFAESAFNARVAQAYIYKAPWFVVWLGVLCVNLLAVTLSRLPWERKHLGFIVTHYAIIVVLAGAMIGLHAGFEGNVTLHQTASPVTRVTTNRSILQLESPAENALLIAPFDASIARPSDRRPRVFPVPGTELRIVADGYAAALVREKILVPSGTPGAAPAAALRLSSAPIGQSVPVVLSLAEPGSATHDFFGFAEIQLAAEMPELSPGGPVESRMVFAKYAPVGDAAEGTSDITVRLSEDGSRVGIFGPDGNGATYRRADLLGQTVNEAGAVVTLREYWPDFVMRDGRPASAADEPNNPAILVQISKPTGKAPPRLDVAITGDRLRYRVSRAGQVTASGEAAVGESFRLGWADWEARVEAVETAAVVADDLKPGPDPKRGEEALPGVRARLEGPAGRGPSRWLESGQVTSLTDGRSVVRVGYGLETRPLPFSIRLVEFEVPRDEGTDTPSDFRATVEFRDLRTNETKTGVARMNSPASFPGTVVANLTGFNYKFSQAEWNPRDLDQTTLQVLYDPGWLLKWVGSLGICVGIALQFYGKPSSSTARRAAPKTEAPVSAS